MYTVMYHYDGLCLKLWVIWFSALSMLPQWLFIQLQALSTTTVHACAYVVSCCRAIISSNYEVQKQIFKCFILILLVLLVLSFFLLSLLIHRIIPCLGHLDTVHLIATSTDFLCYFRQWCHLVFWQEAAMWFNSPQGAPSGVWTRHKNP